ncbi:transcriptional regulator [Mycolicibacterium madagascariense]|uniref:Transcriptional regulator n=1 Tax=Mycolicibacterium madagascariense TaxID=212765 RepID=A0A7I7XMP8_9MYCO|nr:helix-turn-helix domain-containing protein [Mycolicibacterium madagascariense]MCV7013187.1 helix-turn-helix domain-containing protein [Mycolicibacterium madagascariense]BBZ30497.1 transcriptional regulator [Mycolicibacterium madagascariense]
MADRTSPPTERVVAILDFLARHPHDRFGLSELARRLALSKPTCLGILTTLTDSGYLVCDGVDKRYRLGPQLISLGHTAQESMRVDPSAREELRRLSAAFDTTAALSAVIDDRITLLELVGPSDVGVRVGQSYPFAPPVGLMFVLWDDHALRDWLAKEPTIPLRTDSHRLDHVITECRRSGYLVERLTPGGRRLYALMAGMSDTLPQELQALLGEMVSDIGERVYLPGAGGARQRTDISVVSAPVFDHHHRQAMVVSLRIGRAVTDVEIGRLARGVVDTAEVLTRRLSGAR